MLDDRTLGSAIFAGSKQDVSLGNLRSDNRVSLFLMDYANRARPKVFGRASVIEPGDAAMLGRLVLTDYRAEVERGTRITVEALDWNCPQHITPRYTEAQVAQVVETLTTRVSELEAQIAASRLGTGTA